MKNRWTIFVGLCLFFAQSLFAGVTITTILDGSLGGGVPKALEIYVSGTEDLSNYQLNRAADGNPFASLGYLSGVYTDEFVYLTNNTAEFTSVFGSLGDLDNLIVLGGVNGNGNDAFSISDASNVVVDQVWEQNAASFYTDSYVVRKNGTTPDGNWNSEHWTGPGLNFLDGMDAAQIAATVPFGAYQAAILSAEFGAYQVTVEQEGVLVSWETASETDSDYFSIERSNDGINFREIGRIDAAGNSLELLDYSFFDEAPVYGVNYYQVKIVDLSGESYYSILAVVKFETRLPSFTIQPNLAAYQIFLKLSKETDQFSQVEIFDLSGKVVLRKALAAYSFTESVDVTHLAPSQYIAVVTIGNDFYFDRFVKF